MVTPTPQLTEPFLQISQDLFNQRLAEEDLPAAIAHHPILNRPLLEALGELAETAVLSQPAYAYAIMATADAAAQRSDDPFLRALAAWQLARAANGWVRPQLVETAVTRAHALFSQLQEPAWLAACTWQQNAHPWTRSNFSHAVTELQQALDTLLATGFDNFVPECRLSLAYAYLLVGRFEDAERETAVAQQIFETSNNPFGLGRCLYTRASYLRRQTHFKQAVDYFIQAQQLFQQAGATVWNTMTMTQRGLIAWYWQHDAQTAVTHLDEAIAQFEKLDLPLWVAQCRFGLGQIYQQTGQLAEAAEAIQAAREVFARFRIAGLWADSLLESGWLALYQGNYQNSLDYFQQAETLYTEVGNRWLPIIAIMHQGEAYVQMGQYQQALQYLEKASQHLEPLHMPQRQAWCQVRLAHVHTQLNHWPQAEDHLEQAENYYQQTGQVDNSSNIFNLRARLSISQGKEDEALQFLRLAIEAAGQLEEWPEVAESQRLLGHILSELGRFDEAFGYLQTADASFEEMGMVIDQAACQIDLGDYYSRTNNPAAARAAWQQALGVIAGAAPELAWQAHFGLARLAEAANHDLIALAAYRRASQALTQLRRNLWQPAVAGSYLAHPMTMFDRALSLAAKLNATKDALQFIEESKAQTIAKQLTTPLSIGYSLPDEVIDLVAEIRWLQQKLKESTTPGFGGLVTRRELHQKFIQKVRQYDELMSQVERAQKSRNQPEEPDGAFDFDMVHFRQTAVNFLGEKWLAVNYYQNDAEITAVALTPTDAFSWSTPITPALHFSLENCRKAGPRRPLSGQDLTILGSALLPVTVYNRLTPDTHLLIVPNRKLHRLPWAALRIGGTDTPLVTICIPVVVPSLQSVLSLWQRPQAANPQPGAAGLLVAVAEFQGRHTPLPEVRRETEMLVQLFGSQLECLIDADATFENWRETKQEDGVSRFRFLHLATHAFSDQMTGRLSGLALYEHDFWLDELQQLAPLPPLVTLSACSGLRNLVHEGDEQMGLAITCLSAGAQRVVGSLWPVLDESTPGFMRNFYRGVLNGQGVAEALAQAQRTAVQTQADIMQWGSFQCIGQP